MTRLRERPPFFFFTVVINVFIEIGGDGASGVAE